MSDSRVVLVTGTFSTHPCTLRLSLNPGGNAGIGFELIRLLAERGHTVYLGARNATAGKEAE